MAEKEYIECEKLYKDVSSLEVVAYKSDNEDFDNGVKFILEKLDAIPAADVVEVRHGEWERVRHLNVAVNPYQHTCGLCGKSYFDHNKFNYPYCPNCGAKMDGERKADNG